MDNGQVPETDKGDTKVGDLRFRQECRQALGQYPRRAVPEAMVWKRLRRLRSHLCLPVLHSSISVENGRMKLQRLHGLGKGRPRGKQGEGLGGKRG
ncbi:MAG: hypothetical protein LQ348_006523 [Seirophora lacunosa]|nr:MAG: hypothetical protein LQ348_006523 [Seirophora lacunosa]